MKNKMPRDQRLLLQGSTSATTKSAFRHERPGQQTNSTATANARAEVVVIRIEGVIAGDDSGECMS